MKRNLVERIGNYCRTYRFLVLDITLRDVAERSGSNEKALSSFEHGRANNILHLTSYVMACDTDEQRAEFFEGLNDLIPGSIERGAYK